MGIPSPATTELVVKHDLKGRMRIFHKGVPLPGVFNIETACPHGERAIVKVSFIGLSVRFETEEPVID